MSRIQPIQLLYAQSRTARDKGDAVQTIEFGILVQNLAFDKYVAVHWAGDDNIWRILPACFSLLSGQACEQWHARAVFRNQGIKGTGRTGILPGNIRFALQYTVAGKTYWESNNGVNYFLSTETGVLLGPKILLMLLGFNPLLPRSETIRIEAAVHQSLPARRVFVRWTSDRWITFHQTPCFLERSHSFAEVAGPPADLRQNIHSLWTGRILARKAFKVEYAVGCETDTGEVWDNNFGNNYFAIRNGLKVLTLNLHCYQETDQEEKFDEIARAIYELEIDIICLQEVGEEWNDGKGDWQTNAANKIWQRLRGYGCYYYLYTDWSHIGFDRYREGSAVLSKYGFFKRKAKYVSIGSDIKSINSRKVIMVRIRVPYIGLINVFSVHLSWWTDGFWQQFENLRRWAQEEDSDRVAATLLCGDFNTKAGSHGYMLIAGDGEYEDQFLRTNSPQVFTKIFRETVPKRAEYLAADDRIDFILGKKNNLLRPKTSRVLFAGKDYRRVSDHLGYLTEFLPEDFKE